VHDRTEDFAEMGKTLRARPTEYRGIVYESKCEAMFARWLELEAIEWAEILQWREANCQDHIRNTFGGNASWGVIYHPINLTINNWPPDFLAWHCYPIGHVSTNYGGLQVPASSQDIIEYKPSRPTATYCNTFLKNCIELRDRVAAYDPSLEGRTSFRLYYGSVFNNDRGMFHLCCDRLIHDDDDWLESHEEAIKETRFDLEASSK